LKGVSEDERDADARNGRGGEPEAASEEEVRTASREGKRGEGTNEVASTLVREKPASSRRVCIREKESVTG
jgi:hypothetical protein